MLRQAVRESLRQLVGLMEEWQLILSVSSDLRPVINMESELFDAATGHQGEPETAGRADGGVAAHSQ